MYLERLKKAMTYDSPDEIPVSCGILPAAWMHYKEDLVNLVKDYPDIVPNIPDLDNIPIPPTYYYGNHTDEWGCVWSNIDEGMESIVTYNPLPKREDIRTLEIPQNLNGHIPHGFMYLRLLDLRGFEEAMIDFAEECEELQILIDKVTEHNVRQMEVLLSGRNKGDILWMGDDLGMQSGIPIGEEKWRKYLKPAFTKIFAPAKAKGCIVYMHTDGYILEIMQDIMDCGADIINPQSRANGIENLARVCRGKIPIDLDLDRQLFPVASPSQLDDHIRECVESLYLPEGGLGLKAELNYEIPLENMAAIFDALRKYRVKK